MRICSYNINSIRVRLADLTDYLQQHQPAIVGLQETKVTDAEFPMEALGDLGLEVQVFGQKAYHGVALLSTTAAQFIQKGFSHDTPEDQKRLIVGQYKLTNGKLLTVINGYFPQGETREHPTKFPAKEKFYRDLSQYLQTFSPQDYLVVMGDLNISPEDLDIGIGEDNRKRWLRTGKCSFLPEERAWLQRLKDWGLVDSFRHLHPEQGGHYSWFDYRSGGYPDRGLRIDQIWVSPALLPHLTQAGIDHDLRQRAKPSDHCLIWADFDLTLE